VKKTLIIVHPHFTIPGGAGKVILELGKRLAKNTKVIIITQQVFPNYIKLTKWDLNPNVCAIIEHFEIEFNFENYIAILEDLLQLLEN
jgi:hypothetical protein